MAIGSRRLGRAMGRSMMQAAEESQRKKREKREKKRRAREKNGQGESSTDRED